MSEEILCLDASVLVKVLTPEDRSEAARQLYERALHGIGRVRLVAPVWAWAEVGSVLLKKVRQGHLTSDEADALWRTFAGMLVEFVDGPELRRRAWEIAQQHGLPTLYDAAFLACTEVVSVAESVPREFWTADSALLKQLGSATPAYVHEL